MIGWGSHPPTYPSIPPFASVAGQELKPPNVQAVFKHIYSKVISRKHHSIQRYRKIKTARTKTVAVTKYAATL